MLYKQTKEKHNTKSYTLCSIMQLLKMLALPLSTCVTLSELLNLSIPQFLICEMRIIWCLLH